MTDVYHRDQAQRYAPRTPEEVAKAARDLAQTGYSVGTISSILRLDVASVKQLVGERQ